MHPHLTFDLLAWALAFAVGYGAHILRKSHAAPFSQTRFPPSYYGVLAFGAILGAFGFGSLNLILSEHSVQIGRSVVGALAGAIIAIEIYKKLKSVSGSTGGAFVAAFSTGIAMGRIGCFLSGLEDFTYGTQTDLPWAADFGDGIMRHPVQLYEAVVMGSFACIYVLATWRGKAWALRNGFYIMVLVYAAQRFAWEFIKPYSGLIAGLNVFHLVTAGLIVYALYMLSKNRA